MAKKKKHHDEHLDESWLIPYADLLTLLLALFIVLFASSEIDAKKFELMSQSLSQAFNGGTGVLENPSPSETPVPRSTDPNPSDPSQAPPTPSPAQQSAEEQAQAAKEQQETEDLEELKRNIDKYIEQNNMASQIQTNLLPEGLKIVIRDLAFFRSGGAEVKPEARSLGVSLSYLLSAYPRQTIVSGHTDNVPISNAQFRSNWELSSARAVNFLQVILENRALNPALFSATGFGEYKPVAENATEEGRGQNRRVELFIQRKD